MMEKFIMFQYKIKIDIDKKPPFLYDDKNKKGGFICNENFN